MLDGEFLQYFPEYKAEVRCSLQAKEAQDKCLVRNTPTPKDKAKAIQMANIVMAKYNRNQVEKADRRCQEGASGRLTIIPGITRPTLPFQQSPFPTLHCIGGLKPFVAERASSSKRLKGSR